jgi:subtilase family serine protease
MSQKPTAPVSSEPSDSKPAGVAKASTPAVAKGEKAAGAQSNLVTKSVAIGIGSAAIVAALMFVRRR